MIELMRKYGKYIAIVTVVAFAAPFFAVVIDKAFADDQIDDFDGGFNKNSKRKEVSLN